MAINNYDRPIYGTEGGRQGWQQHLGDMTSMIRGTQSQTPVYAPYAPGTLTGQGNALLQQAQQSAEAARKAQAKPPSSSSLRYALVTETLGLVEDLLGKEAQAKGKQQLDPSEVGAWADENLPYITSYASEEGIRGGLPTSEMESLLIDIENYLNAKSGRAARPSLEYDFKKQRDQWIYGRLLPSLQSGMTSSRE